MDDLRHRLRQLRNEKKWTLKETQEKSGVPLSYISAIENGRRRAGRQTLKKLADAFGASDSARKELLSEFQQYSQNPAGWSETIGMMFPNELDRSVSLTTISKEIEDFLLVLGCGDNPLGLHELLDKTDREISDKGRKMSRGFLLKDGASKFLVKVSVSRVEEEVIPS